jgi:four helix bundle protein
MTYKFQKLEIYQLALQYIALIYDLADKLPASENFNLKSQITRAAASIALNIAEGSTSQSDPVQIPGHSFTVISRDGRMSGHH